MCLPLEHGQAVVMRTDTTGENSIAVEKQMMRSECGPYKPVGGHDVIGGVLGGDVFKHNFEFREITTQRDELGVDECRFTVKQIDVAAGHFAMHQQQHASFLYGLKRGINLFQIGHTRITVGGGACRIELAGHHAGRLGFDDFFGGQIVGEVQRHEGLKLHALRYRSQDARFVFKRQCGCGHRWLQIGHDDGAAKLSSGVRHYRFERSAIAHVQMPVVGLGDGDVRSHVCRGSIVECFVKPLWLG